MSFGFLKAGECEECEDASSYNAGTIYLIVGNFAEAASSFAKPVVSPSAFDDYRALFLFVSRIRQEQDAMKSLSYSAAGRSPEGWPTPVFELFLGTITEEEFRLLLDGPYHDDPEIRCEGSYFLAQYYLWQERSEEAVFWLSEAVASGVFHFTEYLAAVEELKRMGVEVKSYGGRGESLVSEESENVLPQKRDVKNRRKKP